MTVHDAQQTRAIFNEYAGYGPEMIKKVSIICALNLYLDFVNILPVHPSTAGQQGLT